MHLQGWGASEDIVLYTLWFIIDGVGIGVKSGSRSKA